MNILLDTHILLWVAGAPDRLPREARALIENQENALFFSAASLCEIAIKCSLGRADFEANPRLLRRGLLDNGYKELPVSSAHAVEIDQLPPIHKDPFDRILVAQSIVEGVTLLTADEIVGQYPGPIRLV
ncbi:MULTISPECIES: type II toxin-antitoxin system VapC family toxin [unclassified Sinorhizobium]|uniref:type II toxin-antitoxin system VapC family toxin n=1 Tax=unclassified Sinorhizobium TaxID=2613772 RepID=UPI0024C43B5E|nr:MULTISPECIES: type II toxin-antitoxin system VapC family toxin [unclassified Sinorhizobium]MDK1373828.1 type II toxin-antitoxin system VapC family toxin [Sinorhizobium sp. 6-70]MDK1482574.1 type II toxin-antitoxin system VapC family toxin [Sinorhizobium sp. 6-117]